MLKEIENINWSEVQNDIRENFSKVKIAKLPTKEQVEFFIEKSKELSKLKNDDKLKNAAKSFKEIMNKENQLRDSLLPRKMVMVYNNNVRRQREYQRTRNWYADSMNKNSYGLNYSSSWPSE